MHRTDFDTTLGALRSLHGAALPMNMRAAFASDPDRFACYSAHLDDLLVDWSKCAVDDAIMAALFKLGDAAGVVTLRDAMFAGEPINTTEGRAVLHVALRAQAGETYEVDGQNVMPAVKTVLADMAAFAEGVRLGTVTGAGGKPITDIVNIGIGGSDLGPAMATLALAPFHDGPRAHFVSNVDGAHIADTLENLDPASTLFILASKTFTTIETMTNAGTARRWIAGTLGEDAVRSHFVAVSTALEKVAAFGIAADRTFGFWDWVGGRYSLWSAIGLPLMIAIGPERFHQFLAGAHAMDVHFRDAPPERNIPVIMGLVGFWHRIICGYATRAVIPYDQRLARLPAYLQQLDMESNGKSATRDGSSVFLPTGPIVWGEPGTNGQHAFFQLIHQGTDVVPVEFILAAKAHEPELQIHHDLLAANCLAQAEALMKGRTREEAFKQLLSTGVTEERAKELAPHRTFAGNRPSITLLHRQLDPHALGRLIALYEHRVFVEAALFGINAFDQWGVELGKELASELLPVVQGAASVDRYDASTAGLAAALLAERST